MLDYMGSRAPCSSMVSESMLLEQVESHAALWAHLWLEASSQQAVSDAWAASALLDQLCQVAKVNSCLTAGQGLRIDLYPSAIFIYLTLWQYLLSEWLQLYKSSYLFMTNLPNLCPFSELSWLC